MYGVTISTRRLLPTTCNSVIVTGGLSIFQDTYLTLVVHKFAVFLFVSAAIAVHTDTCYYRLSALVFLLTFTYLRYSTIARILLV